MNEIICKKCGMKYGYELCGPVYPGCKDRETADCPYCGKTGYSTITSQILVVTKLEKDDSPIENNKEGESDE